jgi:hypothetical protein
MKRSFLIVCGGIGLGAWAVSRLLRGDYTFAGKSVLITVVRADSACRSHD